MRRLTASLVAVALLCACGQKGPLVLPDQKRHKQPATPAPAPAAPATPAAAPTPEGSPR